MARRLRRFIRRPYRPVSLRRLRRRAGKVRERRRRLRELRRLDAGIRTFASVHVDRLRDELTALDAWQQVREAALLFGEGLVMSTSFGTQSAVLLDLVARTAPGTPVIWIDTGYLPAETYRYARTLTERLDLDVRIHQADMSPAHMEAVYGRLWERGNVADMRAYNRIRKVEPMQRALEAVGATAWLSGVRSQQTNHRSHLQTVEVHMGVYKIHPLLRWSDRDIETYFKVYDLPRHPLEREGYVTVGDVHSSRPVREGDGNGRETRFRGLVEECGLHVQDHGKEERP